MFTIFVELPNIMRFDGSSGGDQGWQLRAKREISAPNPRRALNASLIQDAADSLREECIRRPATLSISDSVPLRPHRPWLVRRVTRSVGGGYRAKNIA